MKKILLFALIIGAALFTVNRHFSADSLQTETTQLTKKEKKLTGAERFVQYQMMIRKSPKNSPYAYKSGYAIQEFNKSKKAASNVERSAVDWEERGPGNVSGRSRTVWVDPSDDTGMTWFIGSAQGGVWKTSDGGDSYALKTPDVPHLGTAAIMGSKSSPNVIYAGSGEGFNFLGAAGGGIYKSVDSGESWEVLSSTTNNSAFGNIMRLAVDHTNPDIVYAATRNNNTAPTAEGFVMKSIDGGETWEESFFHFDAVSHVVMDPVDPLVLYAGLNQEGILKTVDGGENWDFIYLYKAGDMRPDRIEIAIAPSDPNYIYFTTQVNGLDRIWVSEDAGANIQEIIPNDGLKDDYSNFSGGQSFWNKAIAVHPFDPLQFYFAGQSAMLKMDVTIIPGLAIGELTVISDGYGAFVITGEPGTKGVHVDHHGITFSITDEANEEFILINTNDGGVAVSTDNGETFKQTGDTFLEGFNPEEGQWQTVDGLNASTFYGVDKMNGSDRYVGGTQDNGSWISPADPDETSRWSYAPSGDGFEAAWNYDKPDLVIESSQFNNFSISRDGGATWRPLNTPGFGPFISAISNSKQDGDLLLISTADGPAVSYDFGDTWIMSEVPDEYLFNGLRMPIDISLIDPAVMWTGSGIVQTNRICVSKDGGVTFQPTNPYTEIEMGEVAGIATHPADKATAYALFGVAGLPKVLRTEDFGDTWVDISGFAESEDGTSANGFPDVPVFSLLVMPYDNNIIWAGTEIGIVESLNGGATWNLRTDGLPATAIWEMKVVNDEVVVATHGRGIWTATLPELDGYEPPFPFIAASRLEGALFDKKLKGDLVHRSPLESGLMTITVETSEKPIVKTYEIGEVTEPGREAIDISFEEAEIGDNIYNATIDIVVFRNGEQRSYQSTALFYDVDADDERDIYSNNFDDGQSDFATGLLKEGESDFSINQPNGFSSSGFESVHQAEEGTGITILQKPLRIGNTGSRITFDEIVALNEGFDIGNGNFFYTESVKLRATNDEGKSWITMEEYSSEAHEDWQAIGNSPNESDYKMRIVELTDYFEEGDIVYFRIDFNYSLFSSSWGVIIDDFTVSESVSTEEVVFSEVVSRVLKNPFQSETIVQLKSVDIENLNSYFLTDINGNQIDVPVYLNPHAQDLELRIDGSQLPSGMYLFYMNIDGEAVTEKLIKM